MIFFIMWLVILYWEWLDKFINKGIYKWILLILRIVNFLFFFEVKLNEFIVYIKFWYFMGKMLVKCLLFYKYFFSKVKRN